MHRRLSSGSASGGSDQELNQAGAGTSISPFPTARIGSAATSSSSNLSGQETTSPIHTRSGSIQIGHQFGSVPASSTAIFYPSAQSTSPARSTGSPMLGTSSSAEYDQDFVRTIGRHLVSPKTSSLPSSPKISDQTATATSSKNDAVASPSVIDPNFFSLSLQGGDITRELYNWQREHERDSDVSSARRGRSRSFTALPRPEPDDDTLNIHNINVPGGFRRNHLLLKYKNVSQQPRNYGSSDSGSAESLTEHPLTTNSPPTSKHFLTRNFLEFLSVYGHFAGEELEEDEDQEEFEDTYEDMEDEEYEGDGLLRRRTTRSSVNSSRFEDYDENYSVDEEAGLLNVKRVTNVPGGKHGHVVQDTSSTKAILLLLKGFVGTGVLFLPKAFYNGGMLFSSGILFFVALLSYYCFILLIDARMVVQASFGDMGGILYGKKVRLLILTSIVLSQIGFAAAYAVFTSENIQAFVLAITDCKVFIPVRYLIFLQMIVFIPLSMVRNISKLSLSALIADFFILLGLAYVYFWDGRVLIERGVQDVAMFNRNDWTLFIGTAIFTFEGIGLVIPIHESMKKPSQFYSAIGIVMVIITFVYICMGVMSYAAYGSNVETVVILNMPQDNRLVNSVQFIYALAILLSTPLQLFPAIRIMENAWLPKSGKHDIKAKWQKNIFRVVVVLITAFIAWGGADDLDKFVALIGSFACIPLTYIYPPLLHYRACARTYFQKGMDVFICVFGLGCMIYTTVSTIRSWATSTPDNDFFRYCSSVSPP
ncbi:transmembrane amino acid transporter protein-domain-containing protein [Dipodascopsis uninucleata]